MNIDNLETILKTYLELFDQEHKLLTDRAAHVRLGNFIVSGSLYTGPEEILVLDDHDNVISATVNVHRGKYRFRGKTVREWYDLVNKAPEEVPEYKFTIHSLKQQQPMWINEGYNVSKHEVTYAATSGTQME